MNLFVSGVEIFVIGIIKKIKSPYFCDRLIADKIANRNYRHQIDWLHYNKIKTQLSSLSCMKRDSFRFFLFKL